MASSSYSVIKDSLTSKEKISRLLRHCCDLELAQKDAKLEAADLKLEAADLKLQLAQKDAEVAQALAQWQMLTLTDRLVSTSTLNFNLQGKLHARGVLGKIDLIESCRGAWTSRERRRYGFSRDLTLAN